jgi:DNA transposition AAA+ family ATPase
VKRNFVSTENAKRLMAAVAALAKRGAREASLMVVDGQPGTSKTETTTWLAVQHGWPMVRANVKWTPGALLSGLCETMRVSAQNHSFQARFRALVEELSKLDADAERRNRAFAVVIDEADHVVGRRELIECVRDLSDTTNVIFILVGIGEIASRLTRFPQVLSRVGQRVEFRPASLADAECLAAGLCEVAVAADLVAYLHQRSGGYHREILDGLARIEAHGRLNGGPVTRAAMAGRPLLMDRKTGRLIEVES